MVDGGVGLIAGPYQRFLRRSDDPTGQGKSAVALPAAAINAAGDRCRGATGQEIARIPVKGSSVSPGPSCGQALTTLLAHSGKWQMLRLRQSLWTRSTVSWERERIQQQPYALPSSRSFVLTSQIMSLRSRSTGHLSSSTLARRAEPRSEGTIACPAG